MPEKAKRGDLIEKGVAAFVALALLPSGDHAAAGRVVHDESAAYLSLKASAPHLAAIDQGKRQPVSKDRAEFLHHVERQAWAPGSVSMQISDLRVEPLRFQRGANVV